MKKLLAIITLALLLFTTNSYAIENPWKTKLPFKSGLITYKVSGSMKGKKALYIRNYGQTTAEYYKVKIKMMGMTQTTSTTTITTPEWIYTIDNSSKQGTKEVNPDKYLIEEFEKLSNSDKETVVENIKTMGKLNTDGMQATMNKNAAKILGYSCDMVEIMGTKIYLFAGTDIPLKTQGNTMGIKLNESATSVKKGTPPEKAFKLPKIRYQRDESTDRMHKQDAKDIIQGLLNGQSMGDINFDDEGEVVFDGIDELPFDEEMTDDDAIEYRTRQQYEEEYNDDDEEYDNDETVQDVKQGLTKMFKSIF